jgi:hypothetical protein
MWADNTNAPKRGKQDKTTKVNRFAAWLGHNDMARVTFKECRDYRDSLVKEAKEGKMSFTSAKQHMKHLKVLLAFACDDIHISADPMARVKLRFGGEPDIQLVSQCCSAHRQDHRKEVIRVTTTDRLRNRHRPCSLGDENRSSCAPFRPFPFYKEWRAIDWGR